MTLQANVKTVTPIPGNIEKKTLRRVRMFTLQHCQSDSLKKVRLSSRSGKAARVPCKFSFSCKEHVEHAEAARVVVCWLQCFQILARHVRCRHGKVSFGALSANASYQCTLKKETKKSKQWAFHQKTRRTRSTARTKMPI